MYTAYLVGLVCVACASAMQVSAKNGPLPSNLLSRYNFEDFTISNFDEGEVDSGRRIPIVFLFPSTREDTIDGDDNDDNDDDDDSGEDTMDDETRVDSGGDGESILIRNKRQSGQNTRDLSLSHTDRNGNDRRPGRIHGRVDLQGSGNNRRNYQATGGVGAGFVLWRSNNRRHSLGTGAYAQQHGGSF